MNRRYEPPMVADLDRVVPMDEPMNEDTGPQLEITAYDRSGSPSYAYLRAIVCDNNQPARRRTQAAIACLPFEMAKLVATDRDKDINKGFAAKLEETHRRSRRYYNANPQIERPDWLGTDEDQPK